MKRFVAWVINYQKKISKSLTIKTFLVLLFLLLTVCAITYLLISLFLPFINEGQALSDLDTRSKVLIDEVRLYPASESGNLFAQFMWDTGADLYLMDEKQQQIDLFTFRKTYTTSQSGKKYPFRFAASNKQYVLIVHFNSLRSEQIKNALWNTLPHIGVLVLVISLLGAFFFSKYTTSPIVRMSKTTANLAELDFSWYCPDLRDDEIGLLAKSINELSDRLNVALTSLRNQNSFLASEVAIEKERERKQLLFFSAVSHEIKTPIAIVIGQLEGMQAEIGVYKDKSKYLARSAEILRSLDVILKEYLSIAYIDIAGKKVHEPISLSDVLISAIDDCNEFIASRSIRLTVEIEPDVYSFGDYVLLKKAFENVLDNAAIYSPEGSFVKVRLICNHNKAIVTIANHGVHILEEHIPHLFEAFYRTEKNTVGGYNGSGLGLYITRMILESHSATHSINNFDVGVIFTAEFHIVKTPYKTHNSSS